MFFNNFTNWNIYMVFFKKQYKKFICIFKHLKPGSRKCLFDLTSDWCLLETLAVNPDYSCLLDREQTWQGAFCSCLGSLVKNFGWGPFLGAFSFLGGENIPVWGRISDSMPVKDFRNSYFSPLCFITGEFP